jgi:predicted transcriptional regulator
MSSDVERVEKAMADAYQTWIWRLDDRLADKLSYYKAHAAMKETMLIVAEALRKEAYTQEWEIAAGMEATADWLQSRAGGDA